MRTMRFTTPAVRVLRVGGRGSPKAVASEMDVLVKYKLDWHTLVGGGYGRFFTG